jgi:hypothetical protein
MLKPSRNSDDNGIMDSFNNYSSDSDLFSPDSDSNGNGGGTEVQNPAVPAGTMLLVVVVLMTMTWMIGMGYCVLLKKYLKKLTVLQNPILCHSVQN